MPFRIATRSRSRAASRPLMQACEPRMLLSVSLVKDIGAGSNPLGEQGTPVVTPNGKMFFAANNSTIGSVPKLFSTDGTAGGTVEIRQIYDTSFGVVGNKVLFNTLNSDNIYRMYITDGTLAGTSLFRQDYANGFISLGSKAIFNAAGGVWVSDGTTNGTKLIAAGASISTIDGQRAVANGIAFFAGRANGSDTELYKSDGVTVTRVKDIAVGSGSSSPRQMVSIGSAVMFLASDANAYEALYKSDGTANGTTLVKAIRPNNTGNFLYRMVGIGNKVFFRANDGGPNGNQLWVSDGTTVGTKIVKAKLDYTSFSGANANGKFLFGGFDTSGQTGLNRVFVTDGNTVTALSAPSTGAYTNYFGSLNGIAYFAGLKDNGGTELFTSNGTTSSLFADLNVGAGSSDPVGFVPSSTGLYFLANNGATGREWFFITGARADAVAVSQGTNRPYRVVQLTFNDNLGASITKDDVVLRRRKDKRVLSGSYWKFSTFTDGQNRTVVQARVTKNDLQGKYEIVILKDSVYSQLGISNANDIRVSFFLEPVVTGATFSGTPVGGAILGGDDDVLS